MGMLQIAGLIVTLRIVCQGVLKAGWRLYEETEHRMIRKGQRDKGTEAQSEKQAEGWSY